MPPITLSFWPARILSNPCNRQRLPALKTTCSSPVCSAVHRDLLACRCARCFTCCIVVIIISSAEG